MHNKFPTVFLRMVRDIQLISALFFFRRNSILFVLLLTTVLADGQEKFADSIGFHSVGNTDRHGLKQGVWLNYRDRYFRCKVTNTEAFVPAEGWFFKTRETGSNIIQSLLISRGSYRNNKRIGTWEFRTDDDNGYFEEGSWAFDYEVSYPGDGSAIYQHGETELKFSPDSAIIDGSIRIIKENITVTIACRPSKDHDCIWCKFTVPKDKLIEECCSNDIFLYEDLLKRGNYNFKIRSNR